MRLLRISDPKRLVHAKAFLFITARNLAIDHIRRTRRAPVGPIDDAAEIDLLEPAPTAAEVLDSERKREAMLDALDTLPERCREVMLLRYIDGFTPQEIAVHLGLASATVRVHLMKGVRDCAHYFRSRGLIEVTAPAKGQT